MKKIIIDAGAVVYGGGSYTYLYNLHEYLDSQIDYSCIFILNGSVKSKIKKNSKFKYYILPKSTPIFNYFLQSLFCKYENIKFPNSIIYILSSFTFLQNNFYILAQSSLPFSPEFSNSCIKKTKLFIKRWLQLRSYSNSLKTIVVSKTLVNLILKYTNVSHQFIILPHLTTGSIKTELVSIKYKKEICNVLNIGKIDKLKGSDLLINAINELLEENVPIRLKLVGNISPEFKLEFASLIEKVKSNPNIIFVEHTDYKNIALYFKEADIYISPSLLESFSITPFEAISHECKVLISDIPVHKEMLNEECNFFVSQSITSLKKELLRLMANYETEFKVINNGWDNTFINTFRIMEGE